MSTTLFFRQKGEEEQNQCHEIHQKKYNDDHTEMKILLLNRRKAALQHYHVEEDSVSEVLESQIEVYNLKLQTILLKHYDVNSYIKKFKTLIKEVDKLNTSDLSHSVLSMCIFCD